MFNEYIELIEESKTADAYGDLQITRTSKTVFAELKSITQSEFYQAQAAGLKPEIKFVIADYLDYNNQKVVKYKPFNGSIEEYAVIRTYRNGNMLEIVCKRGVDE